MENRIGRFYVSNDFENSILRQKRFQHILSTIGFIPRHVQKNLSGYTMEGFADLFPIVDRTTEYELDVDINGWEFREPTNMPGRSNRIAGGNWPEYD